MKRYIEPFCGSAACLLRRPTNHTGPHEILNDKDGLLINTLRAIRNHPIDIARLIPPNLTEIDLHAYQAQLQTAPVEELVARLEGDPGYCDPKLAAWYIYTYSGAIGKALQPGPWHTIDGKLTKTTTSPEGICRSIPAVNCSSVFRRLPTTEDPAHYPEGFSPRQTQVAAELQRIAHRFDRVLILTGDWQRPLKNATLNGNNQPKDIGILLDPPYDTAEKYYDHDQPVSQQVRQWCIDHTEQGYRIVVCGYNEEHDELLNHGWGKTPGKATQNVYPRKNKTTRPRREENLWYSPTIKEERD